ncbi:MAG: GTPase domain-containing protein [bacterium]
MPVINYKEKELSCKIVYFGPSLGGKTTNIKWVHKLLPQARRSDLQQVSTEGDRTLFFDFFSLNMSAVKGLRVSFQVYTVPGQQHYVSTRRMVLNGVDGLVFVADSEARRFDDNVESLMDLKTLLREYSYDFSSIPLVLQYNKRDLADLTPVERFEEILNERKDPSFEAVALEGKGVVPTFKTICSRVVASINAVLAQPKDYYREPI